MPDDVQFGVAAPYASGQHASGQHAQTHPRVQVTPHAWKQRPAPDSGDTPRGACMGMRATPRVRAFCTDAAAVVRRCDSVTPRGHTCGSDEGSACREAVAACWPAAKAASGQTTQHSTGAA